MSSAAAAAAIVALLAASATHAANYTWVGNSSPDWADVDNWRDGNNAVPAVPLGSAVADEAFFKALGLFQPVVSSQQPPALDDDARINRLVFECGGIDISGNGSLLINRGNIDLTADQRFINANAGTTNTISVPIVLGNGKSGTAYFIIGKDAALVFGSAISYANPSSGVRNLFLRGAGTFDLRGTATVADLRAEEGARLLFNNPNGRVYAPTAGYKVRLFGGSAKWLHDNQILANSANNVLLRIDNGAFADLNCKTDAVHKVNFCIDNAVGGTLDTGASGLLRIYNGSDSISVGSGNVIPSTTSVINGNIFFEGSASSTARISTRRGAADADLIVNAVIGGACAVSVDIIRNDNSNNNQNGAPINATSGIVVFNAINTYAQTTKVLYGTLIVNGATGPGKVEIAAAGRLEGTGVVDPADATPPSTIAVNGGTLAPGAPLGTLTIGSPDGGENDVVFNPSLSSVLEIRADASGAATLKVNGKITNAGSATLRLSAAARPPTGRHLVVEASGGIGGAFAAIEGETDLLRFHRSANSKQVWLHSYDLGTLLMVK